jgi:hypothetical protein
MASTVGRNQVSPQPSPTRCRQSGEYLPIRRSIHHTVSTVGSIKPNSIWIAPNPSLAGSPPHTVSAVWDIAPQPYGSPQPPHCPTVGRNQVSPQPSPTQCKSDVKATPQGVDSRVYHCPQPHGVAYWETDLVLACPNSSTTSATSLI